jgi:hypothetical protein
MDHMSIPLERREVVGLKLWGIGKDGNFHLMFWHPHEVIREEQEVLKGTRDAFFLHVFCSI